MPEDEKQSPCALASGGRPPDFPVVYTDLRLDHDLSVVVCGSLLATVLELTAGHDVKLGFRRWLAVLVRQSYYDGIGHTWRVGSCQQHVQYVVHLLPRFYLPSDLELGPDLQVPEPTHVYLDDQFFSPGWYLLEL